MKLSSLRFLLTFFSLIQVIDPVELEYGQERLEIPDGVYENLLGGEPVTVREGELFCDGRPAIFALKG